MSEVINAERLNEKNIPILKGPIQPNPNIKFIYIKDPNGMNIQLVEGSI